MSDIFGETVIAMPALSLEYLETLGETVVSTFQPEALSGPQPIRVREWIDELLPRFGIHVMPASYEELGERVAVTYAAADAATRSSSSRPVGSPASRWCQALSAAPPDRSK